MNMTVATMESFDPKPIPQTPCPLVQPPPRRVPIPTMNPEKAMSQSGATGVKPDGPRAKTKPAPPTNPKRKRSLHWVSPGFARNTFENTPEIPGIFPEAAEAAKLASPIQSPPTRAKRNSGFITVGLYNPFGARKSLFAFGGASKFSPGPPRTLEAWSGNSDPPMVRAGLDFANLQLS